MSTRSRARSLYAAGALLLAAACLSCFGSPVKESMEIVFHPDGSVEIAVTTRISSWAYESGQIPVKERLQRVRDAALKGGDLWHEGILALEPARERFAYELEKGNLIWVHRQALVEDYRRLPSMFEYLPVSAFVERDEDLMTLDLVPSGANRASSRQERRFWAELDRFCESVSSYARRLADVYLYLEENPDRARPVLAEHFDAPQAEEEGVELTEEEEALVEALDEDDSIGDVLSLEKGEAYTLDEISALMFNPFPASVAIEVPSVVEEMIGFDRIEAGRIGVPEIGLWSALGGLHGEWVYPMPFVEYVAAMEVAEPAGEEVDEAAFFESFMSRPRVVVRVPEPEEVREAILSRLRPEDLYRLRWRVPPEKPADES